MGDGVIGIYIRGNMPKVLNTRRAEWRRLCSVHSLSLSLYTSIEQPRSMSPTLFPLSRRVVRIYINRIEGPGDVGLRSRANDDQNLTALVVESRPRKAIW